MTPQHLISLLVGLLALISCSVRVEPEEILATTRLENGKERSFIVKMNSSDSTFFLICAATPKNGKMTDVKEINLHYDRYNDGFDFYEDGIYGDFKYALSPDEKYMFIATDIRPCGSGWMTQYQLFRIDCNTLEVKLIVECAEIDRMPIGFSVFTAEIINADTATCAADYEYVEYLELYDNEGNFIETGLKGLTREDVTPIEFPMYEPYADYEIFWHREYEEE